MRLLECRPDGGFAVTGNLAGNEDLEYAILSHTWGSEEVTFEDMVNGAGGNKNGYKKLEFCADRARNNSLRYFWIDTCCINKFNKLELSNAINSMFRWYQKATKCYVFLSDVLVPDPADVVRQDTWAISFKESRWFTRGWTLQELIAPGSVEFFSTEGHSLGDKTSLGYLICEKTGIPTEVLQNRVSGHFSLSDVMEWSRTRNTTEPEDEIYCLLSMLGIFMAPSYGEGIDNATKRLKDELARAGTKTVFIVPYARNGNFVGYESQLAELEQMVRDGQQARKIAITGPGGIGKSQIALELAYRIRDEHKNCAVFWISATDMDTFSQGCSYIARKLAIRGWDDEKEDARRLLQRHLEARAGKWLIIYDDADDASLGVGSPLRPQGAALLDFMPRSDRGNVIFTTAISDTAKILAPERTMELPQIAAEAAEKIPDNLLATHSINVGDGPRDPGSDIESIFSEESAVSSQSSLSSASSHSIPYSAIKEISDALLSKPELRSLYSIGISRVDERKCRRHFRGFLKKYASNLLGEASDPLDVHVATFIGSAAGKISDQIRRSIALPTVRDSSAEEASRQRLNDWLASMAAQSGSAKGQRPLDEVAESDNDSDDISEPGDLDTPFISIPQSKEFILSANAYEYLVSDMKSWLQLDDKDPDENELDRKRSGHQNRRNQDKNGVETDRKPDMLACSDLDMVKTGADLQKDAVGEESDIAPPAEVNDEMPRQSVESTTENLASSFVVEDEAPEMRLRGILDGLTAWLDCWGVSHLVHAFFEMFMPALQPGHRRLRWRCSCGTVLWGDFDASDPRALTDLMKQLHHIPGFVEITDHEIQKVYKKRFVGAVGSISLSPTGVGERNPSSPSSNGPGSSLTISQPLRSLGTTSILQSNSQSQKTSLNTAGVPTGNTIAAMRIGANMLLQKNRFFEVCVNTGNHAVRLKEIDLEFVMSDRDLFEQIWDRYNRTRGNGIRRIFLKPRDVNFVMFSVTRATYDLVGIHKKPSEYPPQEEVDQLRYHYFCPKILMPANVFLHFLHSARYNDWDTHLDNTWLERLPKKLDNSILGNIRQVGNLAARAGAGQFQSNKYDEDVVIGWGVHILEGPNHVGLSLVLGAGIVVAFLVSCFLIGFAKTQEQGFGVGQFILAIMACGMAAIYFALTDR